MYSDIFKIMSAKFNRVVFYCDDDLKEKLQTLADQENRKVSNLIVTLLREVLDQKINQNTK